MYKAQIKEIYGEITELTQLDIINFRNDNLGVDITSLDFDLEATGYPSILHINDKQYKNNWRYYINGTIDANGVITSDGVVHRRSNEELYPLNSAKADKVTLLKSIGTQVIYEKAPIYKQCNSALNIYDEAKKTIVVNWINAVKTIIDSIETSINNCSTFQELEAITFTYNSIKTLAERGQ